MLASVIVFITVIVISFVANMMKIISYEYSQKGFIFSALFMDILNPYSLCIGYVSIDISQKLVTYFQGAPL
jgi:hypothetical protein